MAEFNKAEYWKNRKAGKRGQGEKLNPVGKSAKPEMRKAGKIV